MTLGPVMIDLPGTVLTAEDHERLLHPLVGGVILFARNYESPEQAEQLVSGIHTLRSPRLLVSVDHEGGRVQRFRKGFSALPPVAGLGEIYKTSPKQAKDLAESTGWLMASELRALDIDFSFAPVLDVNHGVSSVIGDRAFSDDAEAVADLAHSYMIGMNRAGMSAVGKHFPGHGAVAGDTHTEIAEDNRRYEDIYTDDILPFERMIHFGLAGIMPAHVVYTAVDSQPAGFSPFWLKKVLRTRLGFEGVIFSDDLSMQGASLAGTTVDRATAAINAGCDMVLVCNDQDSIDAVLDGLETNDDPASHMRLVRMHGKHSVSRTELEQDSRWQQAVLALAKYNKPATVEMDV